jgi:hypothetical protein
VELASVKEYGIGPNTVIPVYNEQKNLYGGDKKNFVITRDSLYISLFTYKLSLFDFAKLFVITEEMYVVRYNQVRYKQVSLYPSF